MRLSPLLLAALSLSALHHDADACGTTPEPQVYRLSSHYTRNGSRTFVLFDETAPKNAAWKHLAPMSYDSTEIASAEAMSPTTFTLVGPSGTRVVSTGKHFYLSRSWDFEKTSGALEIESRRDDNFSVALLGAHEKVTWRALEGEESSAALERWVAKQVAFKGSVYASHFAGTYYYESVTVFDDDGKMVTLIKDGERLVRRIDGNVLGAIYMDHVLMAVVANGNRTSLIDI